MHPVRTLPVLLLLAAACSENRELEAVVPAAEASPATSAYGRIEVAAGQGRLSAKDALLLKARLLFVLETLPENSPFRPRPREPAFCDEGLTGFYKEVHALFPELSDAERSWLASQSPDLQAIIAQRTLAAFNEERR